MNHFVTGSYITVHVARGKLQFVRKTLIKLVRTELYAQFSVVSVLGFLDRGIQSYCYGVSLLDQRDEPN